MAVLKDLIVHGPSRFLNAAYYNKIDADEISTNTIALQKITAKTNNTISIVAGLVDVDGELHTKSFTNSNIATIDGSFYITPTISLQGDETNGYTAVATNNSISFSGTSYNLGSAYLDGSDSPIAWSTGSTVIVTGEVLVNNEWIPLGTLKGTLSTYSTNTNPNVVGITNILDSVNQSSKILGLIAGTGNLPYRKVKISLISVNRSGLKPLGIYMTAAGSNGRTFLDIYGGNLAESTTYGGLSTPVVRIGNLSGSNLPPVGNVTPNGWGIYTSNGFFSGTMVAKRGIIGEGAKAWTIGKTSDTGAESFLYAPTTGPQSPSANTVGIYIGTDGINNYASSTQYVRIYGGKIYAQGADITGKITASSGLIGGWAISSSSIYSNDTSTIKSIVAGTRTASSTGDGVYIGSNGVLNVGKQSGNYLTFDGMNLDLKTDWLRFDDSIDSIIIGKDNESHISIDYHSMQLKDGNNSYFHVSDFRDRNGEYTSTESFSGNGSTTWFEVVYAIYSVTSITIDGVLINSTDYNYRVGDAIVFFDTAPSTNSTIVIKYITKSDHTKAYTLGVRRSGATGGMSIAEGYDNLASGECSHAEGLNTTANGHYCHSEGHSTVASFYASHAEGLNTSATGYASHAEGYGNFANGNYCHAEGYQTTANGSCSHTQNRGTVAIENYQTVIGKYNTATLTGGNGTTSNPYTYSDVGNYAFIIGNGTGNETANRSNALTVDWNGVLSCRRPNVSGAPSAVKNEFASVFDLIYPVGAIYISVNSTNPSYLFGGTWTQIQGRFLLAAGTSEGKTYTVGQTDAGSKDAVVVSHSHEPTDSGYRFMHAHANLSGGDMSGPSGSGRHYPYLGNRSDGAYWGSGTTTASTGVSGTDKNMPPYTVVYMWKRTA